MEFYEKRAQRASSPSHRRNASFSVGIGAQKLDTIESTIRICCALRTEPEPGRAEPPTAIETVE